VGEPRSLGAASGKPRNIAAKVHCQQNLLGVKAMIAYEAPGLPVQLL